jgi:hypothetical protein
MSERVDYQGFPVNNAYEKLSRRRFRDGVQHKLWYLTSGGTTVITKVPL